MDDTLHNRVSDANATRKRRSSILKSQRPARTPFSELEFNVTTPTDTAKSRRVSFSRRTGVAEFVTNEATTTWKNVYEEHNKSLESSRDDSDVKPQEPPVAHLGKRIFDNQFEEVEAIDYIETITPSISNSLNNINIIQQIGPLESPSNDQVSAPQCNYELTSLTEQQSKLFGNEFTVTGVGEMSGRIEVNFSAIEHIDEGDDLAEIEKDFGLASNGMDNRPADRHDISEYIEVDLDMTNVQNDVCDMSITDTIKSPKVQNVSQNRTVDKKGNDDLDWVSDKENIVINPYAEPKESVNFAINEDDDKVLVFDGKRLTLETEKSEKEYRETLLPDSAAITPERKTITLNIVDDLPNFIPSNSDISQYNDEPLLEPVNKIEIVSKNSSKNSNYANLSLDDLNSVLFGGPDKRQTTMVYEAEDANISMTQALPAKIITETIKTTDRRRTIIYEQDAVNISMTQALPTNILQNDDSEIDIPPATINHKCNTSVTIPNDQPKTLVFDNEGNLSLTQALPNIILLNQETEENSQSKTTYDNVNCDLSITEAVPAGIVIDQVQETADEKQTADCKNDPENTTVSKNDDGDISFTKVVPSNIILGIPKYGKESMTEILPDNVVFKHRDLTKTVVFEDDEGNISITTGIYRTFSHFDESKNRNDKGRSITFKDDLNASEAKSLNANLMPSQIVPTNVTASLDPAFVVSNANDNENVSQEGIDLSKIQNVEDGKKEEIIETIDKNKENTLLVDENKTATLITENINIVKTIADNIRNLSLINFISQDLNPREREELSLSKNKIHSNAPQLSVIVYQNSAKVYTAEDRPSKDDRSATEHSADLDILKIKDANNSQGQQNSEGVNNPLIPHDEKTKKDDLKDEKTKKDDLKDEKTKKESVNDELVLLKMEDETSDGPGDQVSVKEHVIDSPGDPTSVKGHIIGSPREHLSVKEDIIESLGFLGIKKDIRIVSTDKQNKDDINVGLGDEMSVKLHSKDNQCDDLIIKDVINDSPGNTVSIEQICTDHPSGYMLDTANETSGGVGSDQTIFRCMENMSKSGSTICMSHSVKKSVSIPVSSSDLKPAPSNEVKTLEYVLDVLLSVTSSTLENAAVDKETETVKDSQGADNISGVREPSHDSSYFIIDEGTDTQTDKPNSEEAISIEGGRENINSLIINQFASEMNQCDQEIQTDKHGAPLIEEIEPNVRNTENLPEKDESNLHKTLKTANNTQELLNMISDFTDIARSESQIEAGVQCPQVVFSGVIPIADQDEGASRKKLSFAPTRQSIVFNREDLLSNISMAQAALQKSHSELEDSINVNLSVNDSDMKTDACIDTEVVKTLNFDDESFSYVSLKSDNSKTTPLKKINFHDDDLQSENNKSNVIPTYLKDVSDNIKELMADLVKPMADSLPFDTAVDNNRFTKGVSKTSIQLQTDIIMSSQIDMDDDDALMHEKNQDYMSRYDSERTNDSLPCVVDKGDPVIIFDQHNPLNNILLRPLDSVEAHRYSPPKSLKELENVGEDMSGLTQSEKSVDENNENNASTQLTMENLSYQHDDNNSDNRGDTQTFLCNTMTKNSQSRDNFLLNQVKEIKHTEINTDIAMKTNKNFNTTKTYQYNSVKESEVNTNIVMKSNEDLLKSSSSLTIIVTSEDIQHTPSSRQSNETEGAKLKWKDDTIIDYNSISTCSSKKRHYSPGTPRKSSIKKTIDKSPCMKIQKLSDSLIDNSNNLKTIKDLTASNDQRLDGVHIIGNKLSSGLTVQQFRAEYTMDGPKKLVLNKPVDFVSHPNSIRSEVSDSSTGLIPSSILPSSSYLMQLENVSSFTSSKNLHAMSNPSRTPSTVPKSQIQSIAGSKPDWRSGLQSLEDVNDCDSGVNIVAKIDMLPFMGSFECEWESSAVDTWCFRLLHGRIRLTVKLAHRHSNVTRTLVRADTPVTDMVVETVQYEKKNAVAILCIRFASETMRFIVSRAGSKPCFARDVPQLLRRCAAVARVAVRWGRAMHDAKLHLAYTLDNSGHLALKVANIPLRSVWEVNMNVELVVGGAGEVPWPRASAVRVLRVVSDVAVGERDVKRAMHATPRDWGHVPRTLWCMFRFLKQKTRDDDMLLLPTNEVKIHRGILKEHCQA